MEHTKVDARNMWVVLPTPVKLTCSRAITSIGVRNSDMMTNYERVMKRFIPAFRLKAAQMMINEYGIKQQQAAAMLGTTQAAISKYLKEDSEKYSNIKIEFKVLKEFIERMKIADEKSDRDNVQHVPAQQKIRLRIYGKISDFMILEIKDLHVSIEGKEIIKGLT